MCFKLYALVTLSYQVYITNHEKTRTIFVCVFLILALSCLLLQELDDKSGSLLIILSCCFQVNEKKTKMNC